VSVWTWHCVSGHNTRFDLLAREERFRVLQDVGRQHRSGSIRCLGPGGRFCHFYPSHCCRVHIQIGLFFVFVSLFLFSYCVGFCSLCNRLRSSFLDFRSFSNFIFKEKRREIKLKFDENVCVKLILYFLFFP
jgi:hypothetical protein